MLAGLAVVSHGWLLAAPLFWTLLAFGCCLSIVECMLLTRLWSRGAHTVGSDLFQFTAAIGRALKLDESLGIVMLGADRVSARALKPQPLGSKNIDAVRGMLREHDVISRWGEDSLLVALPAQAFDETGAIVHRLQDALETSFANPDIRASAGWCLCPDDSTKPADLVERAELALQTCRRERLGAVCRSSPADAWIDDHDRIEELFGILSRASDMRGARTNRHRHSADLARQAAEQLGHTPLHVILAYGAALIWDDSLAAADRNSDPERPQRETIMVRRGHIQQAIEILEQYGALRRLPLTEDEASQERDILKQLARILAVVDDYQRVVAIENDPGVAVAKMFASDLGELDRRVVRAVCEPPLAGDRVRASRPRTSPQAAA